MLLEGVRRKVRNTETIRHDVEDGNSENATFYARRRRTDVFVKGLSSSDHRLIVHTHAATAPLAGVPEQNSDHQPRGMQRQHHDADTQPHALVRG